MTRMLIVFCELVIDLIQFWSYWKAGLVIGLWLGGLILLCCGCRCSTVQIFVEKDWHTQPGFISPDAHTKLALTFDGSKWEIR